MKYLMVTKRVLLIAAMIFVFVPASADAKLDCKSLDGKWKGTMRGVFRGAISMTIKNCRVSWKLPDRRTNYCRYREKSGKVEYTCSLGSHGIVNVRRNKITMKNIFTAKRHGSYVATVSRVSP